MLKSSLKLSFLVLAASSLNADRAPVEINISNVWKKKGKVLDIDKKMSKEALAPFIKNFTKDFAKLTPSLTVDAIKALSKPEEGDERLTSGKVEKNLKELHKLVARYALVLSLYNSFEKLFFAKEDKSDAKKSFKAEFKKKFFAPDFLYELTLVQFEKWDDSDKKWNFKKFDGFVERGDYGRLTNAFVKGEGKLAQNLANFGIKNLGGVLKNVSALLAAYGKLDSLRSGFSSSSVWLGAAKLEGASKDDTKLLQKLSSILVKSLKFDGGLDKKAVAKKVAKEIITNLLIEEFELANIFKFSVKNHSLLKSNNNYANLVFKNMDFVIKRAAAIYVDMKFDELWDDLFSKQEAKEATEPSVATECSENVITPEVVAQSVAPEAVVESSNIDQVSPCNVEQENVEVIDVLAEDLEVGQIVAAVEVALVQAAEDEEVEATSSVEYSEAEIVS